MVTGNSGKQGNGEPDEAQSTEVATIGWMLATMTTLICEVGSVAVRWIAGYVPSQPGLFVFSDLLLFVALVSGTVSLLLMLLVLRVRISPPPREIVAGSVLIALAPWAVVAARMLL